MATQVRWPTKLPYYGQFSDGPLGPLIHLREEDSLSTIDSYLSVTIICGHNI